MNIMKARYNFRGHVSIMKCHPISKRHIWILTACIDVYIHVCVAGSSISDTSYPVSSISSPLYSHLLLMYVHKDADIAF